MKRKQIPSLQKQVIQQLFRSIFEADILSGNTEIFSNELKLWNCEDFLNYHSSKNIMHIDTKKCFWSKSGYENAKHVITEIIRENNIDARFTSIVWEVYFEYSILLNKFRNIQINLRLWYPKPKIHFFNGAIDLSGTFRLCFEKKFSYENIFQCENTYYQYCAVVLGYDELLKNDFNSLQGEAREECILNLDCIIGEAVAHNNYELAEWFLSQLNQEQSHRALIESFFYIYKSANKIDMLEFLWSKCTVQQKNIVASYMFNFNLENREFDLEPFYEPIFNGLEYVDNIPSVIIELVSKIDRERFITWLKKEYQDGLLSIHESCFRLFTTFIDDELKEDFKRLACEENNIKSLLQQVGNSYYETGYAELIRTIRYNIAFIFEGDENEETKENLMSLLSIVPLLWGKDIESALRAYENLTEVYQEKYLMNIIEALFKVTSLSDHEFIESMEYFFSQAEKFGVVNEVVHLIYNVNFTEELSKDQVSTFFPEDLCRHYATFFFHFNYNKNMHSDFLENHMLYFIYYANNSDRKTSRMVLEHNIEHIWKKHSDSLSLQTFFEFSTEISELMLRDNKIDFDEFFYKVLLVFKHEIYTLLRHVFYKPFGFIRNNDIRLLELSRTKFRLMVNILKNVYFSNVTDPVILQLNILTQVLGHRQDNPFLKNLSKDHGKFFKIRKWARKDNLGQRFSKLPNNPFDGQPPRSTTELLAIEAYERLKQQYENDPSYKEYFQFGQNAGFQNR